MALLTRVGAFVNVAKLLVPAFNSAPVRDTTTFEAALPPVLLNVTVPLDNASESVYCTAEVFTLVFPLGAILLQAGLVLSIVTEPEVIAV